MGDEAIEPTADGPDVAPPDGEAVPAVASAAGPGAAAQGAEPADEPEVVDVPEAAPVEDVPETPLEDVPETTVEDVPETTVVDVPEEAPVHDVPEATVEDVLEAAPSDETGPGPGDGAETSGGQLAGPAEQAEAPAAPDAADPAAPAAPTGPAGHADLADHGAPVAAQVPDDHPSGPAGATTGAPPAADAAPGRSGPLGPPPGVARPPGRPLPTRGHYSAAPWAPGTAPRQAPPPPPAAQRAPSAAEEAGYQSGEVVSGRVASVDEQEVVVDLGEGRTGVISKRHFSADGKADPSASLAVGDEVEAAVLVREDRLNRVVLSRTWAAKQRAWQRIDEASAAREPVVGPVTEVVKGGVVVDIGVRAFLPASQLELRHVDDLHAYVGQTVEALVTEADRSADKVVLSRRSLLRRHEKQRVNELLGELQVGQVRRGRVATITDFGAFVDLGGLRGLLHLSELSWERVERTTDVVKVGDEIDVKVLAVKDGTKKISLSLRAVTPDPLKDVVEGEVVQGVVTRLVDFGAFVRIKDGVEGLVHVSELAEHRIHLPEEVVTPGDEVYVKVLRVDRRRRRLDLSINQAVQF